MEYAGNDEIAIPEWLIALFGSKFAATIVKAVDGLPKLLIDVIDHELSRFIPFLNDVSDTQWQNLVDHYVASGVLTRDQADRIVKLKDTATPMDLIMFIYAAITMASSYIRATLDPMQSLISQAQNKEIKAGLPNYNEVIRASFVAPEKHDQVIDILQRFGLTDEQIELLYISLYQLYDVTTIRTLFLRGVLSEDQMFERMREHGFTDTRIKEIIQSWQIIPSAQDLFYMVGKEAFEPDSISALGLADEFPEDQVTWLEQQGISREWALKYWYAHWDQPSIQMGYEMYHREDPDNPGNTIINDAELDMLFRTIEIPPFWREKLKKIAYAPYTRVDVRRMHDLGILSEEQIVTAYKDLGYDDEKAGNMALFTVLLNQANDKELSKAQLLDAYVEGILSRDDIKTFLLQLGYSEDRAEFIIEYQDYETELSYQKDLIANIVDRYILNLMSESEARQSLIKLNLPTARIDVIMDKASIKVYKNRAKIPKSDLEKMFVLGVIDDLSYTENMLKLGYSNAQIELYINLLRSE